ncbi:pleiotropic regulatory protein RsmS [Vibrio rumoiensis]|uniref:pleiotropic regulatory protein RsmS n=1 Tax=Vibrio rumoiensis TaxID=76258 RepID=UPI0002FCE073|nr:pleiotropic regulatory protein RsmS [Vibrio rumoiensis]
MTTTKTASPQSLDSAPEEVQLAVDLIYLLESNEIAPEVALKALEIVQQDLNRTIAAKQ